MIPILTHILADATLRAAFNAATSPRTRAIVALQAELAAAPREIPGARHNERIVSYGQHCRRGGAFLGVDAKATPLWNGGAPVGMRTDEEAWCAKLQSACYLAALVAGDAPVHGLRVSVAELIADSKASGAYRPPGYVPQPGDLAFYKRAGGNPMVGGTGHVACVDAPDGAAGYWAIGGNEANTILRKRRLFSASDLVGWAAR